MMSAASVVASTLRRIALAVALVVSSATAALAHAHLDRSVPQAGGIVHSPPSWVELWFSETVEPAFSAIEVVDQMGNHVEQGKPELDPGNTKVLRIALKSMTPGTYKVAWRVVSVDTHRASGSFTFSVGP